MRRRRDREGELADARFRLDAETADRMLEGRVAPDDGPPGYAEVAGLLQTLAADLPSRPAAAGEGTIRMMAKVVGISDPPRPSRRPHPLRGSIVVLAMVGTLGTIGVAFAGGLPDAAQRVVSTWFQTIGVTIPRPDDASGGAWPSGTSIADARSVGRSAAGSGNAGPSSSADAALTTRARPPPDHKTP
jgi:hypothetical protein